MKRGESKETGPVGTVELEAFDETNHLVLQTSLSVDEYYDGSHPLIDDGEFRAKRGIRHLRGRVFDLDGKLDQEFTNEYGPDGEYLRSSAVFADGTVTED